MSCKWGSKYVYVGSTEYETVEMDEEAKLLVEEEHWAGQVVQQARISFSPKHSQIPQDSLKLVTTGTLTTSFKSHYCSTIGCSFQINSKINLGNGKVAKSTLWDTAGQERFRTIGRSYYRGADVALIVYDITVNRSDTISTLKTWISDVETSTTTPPVMILIGNKLDLVDEDSKKRAVDFQTIKNFAEEIGITFAEVSAKSGSGLDQLFARMYSESYMHKWRYGNLFDNIKVVILGDSGVGKTALFDRLEGFSVDLTPLATKYPINVEYEGKSTTSSTKNSIITKIEEKKVKKQKWVKKPDTNVISINLGHLGGWAGQSGCEIATGDPSFCKKCKSAFSSINKQKTKKKENQKDEDDEEKFWICDFCKTENELLLEPEEIPESTNIDYLETGTPTELNSDMNSEEIIEKDESFVIFCIDTSGSMVVASPMAENGEKVQKSLKKKKEEKEKKQKKNQEINLGFGDAQSQYLPNEKNGTIYVSRLEAVQTAIEGQLIDLQQKHPSRRVILISFANEVIIYGDGSLKTPITLAGDLLKSEKDLNNLKKWWNQDYKLIKPIIKSRSSVSAKLFDFQEEGQTALGPALLSACNLAILKPCSKIILCTDGLANVGVGSMDSGDDIKNFYDQIAKKCLKNNSTISLMSFKGSDCNIEVLGAMATKTGGQVDTVEPAEVQKNFQSMFADDTIVTDVEVKCFLPEGLKLKENTIQVDDWLFVDENNNNDFLGESDGKGKEKLDENNNNFFCGFNSFKKLVGSVNSDSNLLIEFEIDENKKNLFNDVDFLPFQFQIKYTRVEDGKRLIRVITKMLPITKIREEAEKSDVDAEAVALNAVRRVAQRALEGNYTWARLENYAYLQLMKRIVRLGKDRQTSLKQILDSYVVHNRKFEDRLWQEQKIELKNKVDWDETEEDMLLMEELGIVPMKKQTSTSTSSSGWFSGLTSFLGLEASLKVSNSTAALSGSISAAEIQSRRATKSDDVSNLLWNMSGANML